MQERRDSLNLLIAKSSSSKSKNVTDPESTLPNMGQYLLPFKCKLQNNNYHVVTKEIYSLFIMIEKCIFLSR